MLGLLQAPATQLVRLLNEPGSDLARVIDAIGKKNGDAAPRRQRRAADAASGSTDAAPGDAAPTGTAPSELSQSASTN